MQTAKVSLCSEAPSSVTKNRGQGQAFGTVGDAPWAALRWAESCIHTPSASAHGRSGSAADDGPGACTVLPRVRHDPRSASGLCADSAPAIAGKWENESMDGPFLPVSVFQRIIKKKNWRC